MKVNKKCEKLKPNLDKSQLSSVQKNQNTPKTNYNNTNKKNRRFYKKHHAKTTEQV